MALHHHSSIFDADRWFTLGRGPRYVQLHRHMAEAIRAGTLSPDDQLPSERDIADLADISRVTVRKAVAQLVSDGLIEQRQGAGSFVTGAAPKLQQSLTTLVSFTENMRARGVTASSEVLSQELVSPNPDEMVTFGLAPFDKLARVVRLRSAGDTPMALETSSLPADVLPDPSRVSCSLYAVLRETNHAPTRAIQRVTAVNLTEYESRLLKLPVGAAVLKIVRTGYLATGRPIELTTGFYRSDIYDFMSEIRPERTI